MGIYVITGGSSGIGAKTVEILKEKGHQVAQAVEGGGLLDQIPAGVGLRSVQLLPFSL